MNIFAFLSPILFVAIVTILGFVTPGYNHLSHTISRLAIEQYGWIQTINFFQLAIGCILIGINIAKSMQKEQSRRIIRIFFTFTASILVLAALAPTDPIDNVPFRLNLLTPMGSVHAGTIFLFLFLSPVCIASIIHALKTEPDYRQYASFIQAVGIVAFVASITWFLFFVFGIFLEYRGLFQKVIALLVISAITLLHVRSLQLPPFFHGARERIDP